MNTQSISSTSLAAIYSVIHLAERLKYELRHSWTDSGKRCESVAEHTWRVGLIAVFVADLYEEPLDLTRLLKMIIVHDLVEAIAGDVPVFEAATTDDKAAKVELEVRAMKELEQMLGDPLGGEVSALWYEFEARKTAEAKLAQALDKLEAQIQHNEAPLSTWLPVEKERLVDGSLDVYCEHSPMLTELLKLIREEGVVKLSSDAGREGQ